VSNEQRSIKEDLLLDRSQEKWKREKKVLELRRIKWCGEIRQLESDMWLGGCGNKELHQLTQRREKGSCKTQFFIKG